MTTQNVEKYVDYVWIKKSAGNETLKSAKAHDQDHNQEGRIDDQSGNDQLFFGFKVHRHKVKSKLWKGPAMS